MGDTVVTILCRYDTGEMEKNGFVGQLM